jgi:hypothetical protein
VKQIKLYVEGGGDSKEQHARCREGFRKLLEKSGFSGRLPRIVAGGGREATFDQFKTSVRTVKPGDYPILLVDSEEVIGASVAAWVHLRERDGWDRPNGVADDQAHLMVTCMEAWIMADHPALRSYYGRCLHAGSLLPTLGLETRHSHSVQDALVTATRDCQNNYRKGDRSFKILAELDPETLKRHLPHFLAFIQTLENHSRD